MSYILDALRKSETERRQGKVPNLGQQMQLIHRPKKRRMSPIIWVVLALLVNAGVLAVVFWPQNSQVLPLASSAESVSPPKSDAQTTEPDAMPVPVAEPSKPMPEPTQVAKPPENVTAPVAEQIDEPMHERPTIITPSLRQARHAQVSPSDEPKTRVPHLVELPLSFQKSIPDLMFNSHIYSSDPYASRVMINGHYLRQGESFAGLTVKAVTQDGVVLSKQGQRFRVGIVRDWVSPR